MIGLTGVGISDYYNRPFMSVNTPRKTQQDPAAQQARGSTSTQSAGRTAVIPAAQTGVPVQAVQPVKAPPTVELDQADMLGRLENDPAAAAARGRIQYAGERPGTLPMPGQSVEQTGTEDAQAAGVSAAVPGSLQTERSTGLYNAQQAVGDMKLPDAGREGAAFNIPGAVATPYDTDFPVDGAGDAEKAGFPDLPGGGEKEKIGQVGEKSESARETVEEGECQTCKNRKYQDGSDDPGVSFKTPTHVSPDQAASAVAGHENEHVVREQAKAQREDRKVVSQSVTYHTAICPECGRVYVSGGTTRTVTANDNKAQDSADSTGEDGTGAVSGVNTDGKAGEDRKGAAVGGVGGNGKKGASAANGVNAGSGEKKAPAAVGGTENDTASGVKGADKDDGQKGMPLFAGMNIGG